MRLLLLACSQRKRLDPGLLPAVERYDGPTFRVLRRFFRQEPTDAPDCYVLSAQFGLIPGDHPIPHYDQRMTHHRARELQPDVGAALHALCAAHTYDDLCICMGRTYAEAMAGFNAFIPFAATITIATGTIGKMQAMLRDWLYKAPHAHNTPVSLARQVKGTVRIRGVNVALTTEQVLDTARQALAEGRGEPGRYQAWYVDIDGQRVSPKWLVSQVTGLPVSGFVTDEARRLLVQMGIEVQRQ